ncbi:acyl-CoA dehydrogenase family protein [Ideonella sp.]|uniref:acyl-CoA dehydrogenase family protein n=1 Tax=Ideonella sp. TaxID=1929293 RepID=UPI003BB66FC8
MRISDPVNDHPARAASAALGMSTLSSVVESGLLGCAVSRAMGGNGGSLEDLREGARRLGRCNRAAGWVLWAQRLAIEALLHSPNIALREHLLPDMLQGERAGTLPMPPHPDALVATDAGRGQRLYGKFACVPNLQWQGYTLVAPVQFDHGAPQWVLLRSEEDGLRVGEDLRAPCPHGCRASSLILDGVFFRTDEWLAGADLPDRLRPVSDALACGLE